MLRAVFLTVTVLQSSGIPAHLATRASDQGAGIPCMVCTYTLASFRKAAGKCLDSWGQQRSGRMPSLCAGTSCMLGGGQCCSSSPPSPMRDHSKSIAKQWEGAESLWPALAGCGDCNTGSGKRLSLGSLSSVLYSSSN